MKTDNSIAIRAQNISKIYQLYHSPLQKLLSNVGFSGMLRKKPMEYAALDNISLEIRRGEKVAIIGRNGAGKSTFLKLVSGVSEPTMGSLEVNGQIHALLTIGSGFHQDFTGRENVYAYLANQGIAGKEADHLVEDITDFAEIEDYIDQPLRTYSTGMGVRLMFATSTVIAPDILILDEVLGVGDAYFAQKSYERMREMAKSSGTTLLLVTHDIYSAVKLCERVIWVDRGRILIDGEARKVVAAYENSIKIQEEERLRIKNMRKAPAGKKIAIESQESAISLAAGDDVLIEIKPGNGMYFEAPFAVRGLTLYSDDDKLASWSADDSEAEKALLREGSQWGGIICYDERPAFEVKDYGNPFQKAALKMTVGKTKTMVGKDLCLAMQILATQEVNIELHLRVGSNYFNSQAMQIGNGASGLIEAGFSLHKDEQQVGVSVQQFAGTADIVLHNIRLLQNGKKTLVCEPGAPFVITADYEVKKPDLAGEFEFLVALHLDGVKEVCRAIARHQKIPAVRRGHITMSFANIGLGKGEYSISIVAAKAGYYDNEQEIFYNINPDLYCCYIRVLNIVVDGYTIFLRNSVLIYYPEFDVTYAYGNDMLI